MGCYNYCKKFFVAEFFSDWKCLILWVYSFRTIERSTRGDASIGTITVVNTCGYTPPTRTFQSSIGSGQRDMECCWEHWVGVVMRSVMACVSVFHDTWLVRLIQLDWRYHSYTCTSGTSNRCEELFHWDFPPFFILLEWCPGQVIVGVVDQVGGFRLMST